MSTIYVTDPAESGELPRLERTLNLAPYVIGPPVFRRPEATGELPIIVDVADRQRHDEPTPGYVGRHRRPEPAGRPRSWPRRLLDAIVRAYAGTVAK